MTTSPVSCLLTIFHLNCITLQKMKMNWKHFLFHSWKIKAEGRIPLNIHTETPQGRKAMFPVLSAWMTVNARILCTGFVRVISDTRKSWYSNFHPSKQVFMATINLFTIPIQVTIELLKFLCIWCIFKKSHQMNSVTMFVNYPFNNQLKYMYIKPFLTLK